MIDAKIVDNRPAITVDEWDDFGEPKTVEHVISVTSAKVLRDRLDEVIREIETEESSFSSNVES